MGSSGESIFLELKSIQSGLASEILDRQFILQPELKTNYSDYHIKQYKRDVAYHLDFLAESCRAGDMEIYLNFIRWGKSFFSNLGIPDRDMLNFYGLLKEVLLEKVTDKSRKVIRETMEQGISLYASAQAAIPSFLDAEKELGAVASNYMEQLLGGEREPANAMILQLAESGIAVKDIYLKIFQPVLYEIGRLWQSNMISVAQEHYCTASTQMIMSRLYPYIFNSEKKGKKLLAASVSGELHEVGIRMIADIFELEGWDTYYLGANTPADSLVESIRKEQPDVLAISATMTFHIEQVSEIIEKVAGIGPGFGPKIMVGGYPFKVSENLWKELGAHGFAADAVGALEIAEKLIS